MVKEDEERAPARPYVAVAGGANMDIGAHSFRPLIPRDSNPGRVWLSPGGVGRNMAHNAALLGLSVHLVTAFGDDAYGRSLRETCTGLGMDVSGSATLRGERTSTYLFITDPAGEMQLAVSDMAIFEKLCPDHFQRELPRLNRAAAVALDTNLTPESLDFLAQNVKAPLFADPVSTTKAQKLGPILSRLHTLKPNRLEAELLTGVAITDEVSLRQAAAALLRAGVQRVFISLGGDGVLAAAGDEMVHLPNLPVQVANVTGGGDAFMAGLLWAHVRGLGLVESARAALAASALAVESNETINPNMSQEALLARLAGSDERSL